MDQKQTQLLSVLRRPPECRKAVGVALLTFVPAEIILIYLHELLDSSRAILKGSFISTVRPAFHTNPSQKRTRSSNQWNLKTPALRFSVDEKHFENRAFRKP